MMGMADLTECLLVWVLLGVVHSGRHSGSLSESTAVFLIPPLAEFLLFGAFGHYQHQNQKKAHSQRCEVRGREREREKGEHTGCLSSYFCQKSPTSLG